MLIDSEYEYPIEVISDSAYRPWRGFRVVEKALVEAAECTFTPAEVASGIGGGEAAGWSEPLLDGELPAGGDSADQMVTLRRNRVGVTGVELEGRWFDLRGSASGFVVHPSEVSGRYVWDARVGSVQLLLLSQSLIDNVARDLGHAKSGSVMLPAMVSHEPPGFMHAVDQLVGLARPDAAQDVLLAETLAHAFVAHLLDRTTNVTQGRRRRVERLSVMALRQVHERIVDGLHAPLDLAVLAEAAGMSNYHFARAFKHTTGRTPHEYVMAHRLERAATLISGTSRSVTEIAFECGFSTPSHLTSQFRGRFGVVPSEWRRVR
jgi:AraC-like DNA-binding protein